MNRIHNQACWKIIRLFLKINGLAFSTAYLSTPGRGQSLGLHALISLDSSKEGVHWKGSRIRSLKAWFWNESPIISSLCDHRFSI